MKTMREVSKEEFYDSINPQNVSPSPEGNWPYTSMWKTPFGEIRGKTVGYIPQGSALEKKKYFLPA